NSVNISLVNNGDCTYTFSDANNNLTEINNLNESLVVEDGNLILTDTSGNAISVELQNLSAQTFTTDATAPREFPSILITTDATGTNFNFEVGVIDGLSIQDGSIRQIDLAGASVGSAQLRDNSVTTIAIAENAVTSIKIANNSVTNTKLDKSNIPLSGFAPPNADVNLGNFKIINLAGPTQDQDAANKLYVDNAITAGTADGSETILNNGTNINITGIGTTGSPYVINNTFTEADGSVTNEIQTLTSSDGSVNITTVGPTNTDYNLTVPAATPADGSETEINPGTNITITGNGTSATPYVINGTVNTPDGSETEINSSPTVTVTGTGTSGDPYILTSTGGADGSETIINPSATVTVAGSGTSGDPYVLTSLGGADGSETVVNGSATVTVTGTGTGADPYVLTSADTS
ncbi:MAG: hypothetical protein ACKVJF_14540, partial [Flavobacteriales bacterium]